MTEPEKVMAPIATPSPISMRLMPRIAPDGSTIPNADGIEEGSGADQHSCHADQRVECGNQLRHRRHLDSTRRNQPDGTANEDGNARFRRQRQDPG